MLQGSTKFLGFEEPSDISNGVQVLLEAPLRHEEEENECYRLAVEGVEGDSLLGAAQGGDGLGDCVGSGVWNTDAETDAGAHGAFAFENGAGDCFAMRGLHRCGFDKPVEQGIDGAPTVGGGKGGDDLVCSENSSDACTHGLSADLALMFRELDKNRVTIYPYTLYWSSGCFVKNAQPTKCFAMSL